MVSASPIHKFKRPGNAQAVFSILIPAWNNLPYLKLCIESIRKNSRFQHQIIVHVNENKDNTLNWVKSASDLDYSFSENNIGVCYALNAAATLAETDYIVYINDDMYACPDWDLHLFGEIKKIGHPYFFLSSTAIEPYGTGNPCAIIKDFGKDIDHFDEKKLLEEFSALPMTDWQGATWPPNVVHKDIWNLVGGYSIEYSPGMYSDPDFSMKLWKMGVRLFKGLSASRFYHFGSRSARRVKKNKGYYSFIEKWGMTSGTFTKHYLKRGMPFNGPLGAPGRPSLLAWKNLYKRLVCAIRSRSMGDDFNR
ncbi:MAG: glycosyltransferase family 2 protein [Chitinophagales bacterium]